MQIRCPHCGPRDLSEFTYQGDATRDYPGLDSGDADLWDRYVHARKNPAGPHSEFWHHTGGCRSHLRIRRDTRDHRIHAVELASGGRS